MWDLSPDQAKIVEELEQYDDKFLNDLIKIADSRSSKTSTESFNPDAEFLDELCHEIEDEASSSHQIDKKEYKALVDCSQEANKLLNELSASKEFLDALIQKYDSVAQKTTSLHEACDKLMSDQTALSAVAEEMRHRLTYFDRVDQIAQKLQFPSLSVTGESFMQILMSIDETMVFLSNQPDYKETSVYLSKCKQCLGKALNKVKQHVYNVINKACETVHAKFNAPGTNKVEDTFTLFYGLFGTYASGIKSLMENLEKKRDDSEEYRTTTEDCYAYYFQRREQLLAPSVTTSIEQLKKTQNGTCLLIRSVCSLLLRLCDDEFHLYNRFFTQPTDLLHDYLERLCRIFYDTVRPVVIHAQHFETLAELCSILKYEMLDQRCSLDPEIYAGFIRVIEELCGDATERLVYKAQTYARNDVQNFQPSPGDLAYPDKLKMMEAISKSITDQQQGQKQSVVDNTTGVGGPPKTTIQRKSSVSSIASSVASQEVASINALSQHVLTAADLHGLWYPTVKRTVLCLSKLFRCLEATVFQSISEEILFMCLNSLISASEKIANNKGCINGHLFLIKHLLIIREQTAPFRGSCYIKEASVDLSKIKDSAWNFLQHKSRWFSLTNNALLEFLLQAPANITENIVDSRKIVDLQLRDACQNLIGDCSKELTKDLDEFIEKAQPILAQDKADAKKSLKQQPFSAVQVLQDRVSEAYKKLRTNVPMWKALLSTYISNRETETILFAPIKKNVEKAFATFRDIIDKHYDAEEVLAIGCPSAEEVSMLLM